MATGIVRGLVGSVTVTNTRGVTRQLRTGDTVELNETVQAANGSTVHIAFDNGNFATVGSNEKLVLDASVIDPMAESDNKAATDLSVADIQAMIAAGADPTEIAEATAAGGGCGNPWRPEPFRFPLVRGCRSGCRTRGSHSRFRNRHLFQSRPGKRNI